MISKKKPKKNKEPKGNKRNIFFSIISIIIVLICVVAALFINMSIVNKKKAVPKLNYPQFEQLLNKNEIRKVDINYKSNYFIAINNHNVKYSVPNPKYHGFTKDLLLHKVVITEIHPSLLIGIVSVIISDLAIPGLFILLLFYLLKKQTKTNIKKLDTDVSVPQKTFKDMAGNKEIKTEMENIIKFLKNPKAYKDRGVKFPNGIILYGPPGTGKTLTAKVIAGESKVPFFSMSGSDFIEMYAGLGAKRVRDLFEDARKTKPAIVFIDEIDAIGGKRTGSSNDTERTQTLNSLLAEMDGFSDSDGILVVAATNRLEDLDEALIRAGRFDKHIMVPLPEKDERLEILKRYIVNKKYSKDISLEKLSKETIGFSGADIENLINEANFISVTKEKKEIDIEDLDDAFFKIVMKGHKKPVKKDNKETELIAYHETGHALANLFLKDGDEINKVTIIPSSSGAGGVTITTPQDTMLYSKSYLETKIKVLQAGRIGEYIFLKDENKITTGASNDIEQITMLANDYITKYGMNEKYGMLNLSILNVDTDKYITEVIELVNTLYNETLSLLSKHEKLFRIVVDTLLEKETITGDELNKIYNKYCLNNTI